MDFNGVSHHWWYLLSNIILKKNNLMISISIFNSITWIISSPIVAKRDNYRTAKILSRIS